MWFIDLLKKIWSAITFEISVKRLTNAQKNAGFQIKSFTLSSGSNLTPTQTANALRRCVENYKNGKYEEIIIPDEIPGLTP
jgi:hypothetical protein